MGHGSILEESWSWRRERGDERKMRNGRSFCDGFSLPGIETRVCAQIKAR